MNKILIVDDDVEFLETLKIILGDNNFLVESVESKDGIFLTIINFQPDIILLDVNLNGFDGRNICNGLKNHPRTNKIPIILISADQSLNNPHNKCNAEEFMPKPLEIETLVSLINKYVQSEN